MIDGKIEMTESVAISQYLVERYGPSDLQVKPSEEDYPLYLTLDITPRDNFKDIS